MSRSRRLVALSKLPVVRVRGQMADIFISYKREERGEVERLAAALRGLGFSVWFDASLAAGETFSDEIDREVRAAAIVLVCWSTAAAHSRWVKAEAQVGFSKGNLISTRVVGSEPFEPPVPFNSVHMEDLREWLTAPNARDPAWKGLLRRAGLLAHRADVADWGALPADPDLAAVQAWFAMHGETSPLVLEAEASLIEAQARAQERSTAEAAARERFARFSNEELSHDPDIETEFLTTSRPRERRSVGAAGRIFAIASGKGGVGRSWFSTMLAMVCARHDRTLLVDCDFALANIDVILGVRPKTDMHSIVRGMVKLEDAITPVLGGADSERGFDLIAGHSGSGALGAVSLNEVARVAQGIVNHAPQYGQVILDLAAGVDPSVMRLARVADEIVLVTTEEPTALTDAYAFTKLLRLQGSQMVPWIVVNMVENRVKGRKVFDQFSLACNEYLGFKPQFAGAIRRDPRVADSVRAQTPLPIRHPQNEAFADVVRVAEMFGIG